MYGSMMQQPLLISTLLVHAERHHGEQEMVSRRVEGDIHRTTYRALAARSRKMANALASIGIKSGDRVATLAWNGYRHVELYYAVSGSGAVLHTLNPRLHPDQVVYIADHAEDQALFFDLTFLPLVEATFGRVKTIKTFVAMTDRAHMPATTTIPNLLCYEELADAASDVFAWPEFDENQASSLCYTSGTTGNPKGVLYSHRSNYIHTLTMLQPDVMGLSVRDTVLAVVPMFHANAWGLAFSCPAVGAKMVMPGPKMDGASIHELIETEGVTFSAAVPTVWQMLLAHLRATKGTLSTLKRVAIGGSAVPEVLIRAFHDEFGVDVMQLWGMTESSPLGTVAALTPEIAALPFDQQIPYRLKQGRPPVGVQLKLTDEEGQPVSRDGEEFGRLSMKGPFVVREYFRSEGGTILDDDDFFDTGDVATIDPEGYMRITDRSKDVIKSGGEWISSIEIENIAAGHPKAFIAAVIGIPHPKWEERPLLLVQLKPGETATPDEFIAFLDGKIAKWWIPEEVRFVDEIPLGGTGKIDKKLIRQRMAPV